MDSDLRSLFVAPAVALVLLGLLFAGFEVGRCLRRKLHDDPAPAAHAQPSAPAAPVGSRVGADAPRSAPQVFVLVGEPRPDLRRRILAAGGRIEETITTGTDVVVFLGPPDAFPIEREQARLFGAISLNEEELLDYVGRER